MFPFSRRREPARPTTERADLDFFRPLDFTQEPPARARVLADVEEHIARLTPAAVDGGNGDVLDDLIDSWHEQWCADLEPEHTARIASLQRLIGHATTELAAARADAAATKDAYDDALAAYQQARDAYQAKQPRGLDTSQLDTSDRKDRTATGSPTPPPAAIDTKPLIPHPATSKEQTNGHTHPEAAPG